MIDEEARDFAQLVAQIADAEHGSDVLILQVGDVLGVTEYFVIASGANRRQVNNLIEEIESQSRDLTGRSPIRMEGVREQQWALIDYGDVIVHVFLSEIREFYEIERLYTDVPVVQWQESATG
jgi:ribosome-associated protein